MINNTQHLLYYPHHPDSEWAICIQSRWMVEIKSWNKAKITVSDYTEIQSYHYSNNAQKESNLQIPLLTLCRSIQISSKILIKINLFQKIITKINSQRSRGHLREMQLMTEWVKNFTPQVNNFQDAIWRNVNKTRNKQMNQGESKNLHRNTR